MDGRDFPWAQAEFERMLRSGDLFMIVWPANSRMRKEFENTGPKDAIDAVDESLSPAPKKQRGTEAVCPNHAANAKDTAKSSPRKPTAAQTAENYRPVKYAD